MEKIDLTRRGRLEITELRGMDVSLHKAFGYLEFIPVYAQQQDFGRNIIMAGISPHFEQVPEGSVIPCYDILFDNGNISVVKKD